MSNTNDFSGVNIGDKLWSIQLGNCVVERKRTNTSVIMCITPDGAEKSDSAWYHFDGKHNDFDYCQSLFWSKPEIIAPENPRKMVKRETECFAVVVNGKNRMVCLIGGDAEEYADGLRDEGVINIKVVRCTGEYEEVEE